MQTDRRTSDRYIRLSVRRGQHDNNDISCICPMLFLTHLLRQKILERANEILTRNEKVNGAIGLESTALDVCDGRTSASSRRLGLYNDTFCL